MCVFKSNVRFADVTSELDTHTKTLTKRDTVIIIGGQNDINLGGHLTPEEHVDKLQRAAQNTKIVVSTLPFWHNKPTLCKEISHANNQLKLHLRDTHVKLFELNFLSEKHFTRHGLHLNLVGNMHSVVSLQNTSFHKLGSVLPKTHPHPHLLALFHPLGPLWPQLPYPLNLIRVLPLPLFIPLHLSPAPSSPLVTAGTRYFLRPRTRGKYE